MNTLETSSDTAASTPEDPSPEKELSSGEAAGVDLLPPGWQEFKKFGRITKKFLEDRRFSSHVCTATASSSRCPSFQGQ